MSTKGFTVRLGARVDQYVAAMEQAKRATTGFSAETSRNLQKVGAQMQAVGGAMTRRVTLPLVALGSAAGKLGYSFDQSFGRMVGLANVAAGSVDALKASVLQLSKDVAVGPQELAEALYFANSAGLDAAAAMDALEVSAQAASAGMGSTTDVVGLVASAIQSYGAANITAAEATDILTATIREGRADPAELAGSLGRILPIASQLGMSFADVGGATAYLSNTFGDTGRTVTAMSGFLAKLVAPTKHGREALTEMGTSMEELQAAIRSKGLLGALELLREKGFAGNQLALRALFDDIEGYQGALALLSDKSGNLVKNLEAVNDATGATGEAFNAVASTDSYRVRESWNSMMVTLTKLGGEVLPLAGRGLGMIAGGFDAVVGVISDLPDPLQDIVIGLVAFVAAAGPVLSIAGSMVRNFETLRGGVGLLGTGLDKIGISAGAAGSAAGALGGLVVAAGAAYALYQAFGAEERKVAERSREVAEGLADATRAAIDNAGATDTARIAHLALSNALSNTGDDGKRLTEALGTLGLTTADALDVLVDVDKDPVAALKRLAMQAGATADEAQRLAEKVNASDEPFWGAAAANSWLTDELVATGKAMEEVQDQSENVDLDQMIRSFLSTDAASSDARQGLLAQAEAMSKTKRTGSNLLPLYAAYTQLLAQNKGALDDNSSSADDASTSTSGYTSTLDSATIAASDLLDVLKSQTSQFDDAASAASGFKAALDAVFGGARNMEQAEQDLAASVDRMAASFHENGKTLDIGTEKGRANRDAVKSQVDAIGEYMVAMLGAGKSTDEATAAGDYFRQGLIDQLSSFGLTNEEAAAYLATLGLTPESISTAVKLANDAEAKRRVEELLAELGELPGDVALAVGADIESGQFDEAERRLLRLQRIASGSAIVQVSARPGEVKWQAAGGFFDRAQIVGIGEDGDEVALPLSKPGRLRALLADGRVGPRVAAALGKLPWLANGGGVLSGAAVTGRVMQSGQTANIGELMAAMFETGDLSVAEYRAYLSDRLSATRRYSSEWMSIWRSINDVDAQQVANEDRIQQAMLETGAISTAAYEQYLQRRLGATEQYSEDWMGAWRQLQSIHDEEEQRSEDSVRAAFDRARAQRQLIDAERDLADAIEAANEADAAAADRGLSSEERVRAERDATRARERVADAAFAGAEARAAANGLTGGTVDWARFVRDEIGAYAASNPELAARLDQLLAGVPAFATGGMVRARPGVGMFARLGEGNEDEFIRTRSQMTAFRDTAAAGGAASMTAAVLQAVEARLSAGGGVTVHGGISVGSRADLAAVDQRLAALAWRMRARR